LRLHVKTANLSLMRTLLFVVCASVCAAAQQSASACQDLPKIAAAPVVTAKIRGEYLKEGRTLVQDIFLQGTDGLRVPAFVVRPYKPAPNPGAVLFIHLLAPPPDNDREEFFADALELADHNVVSLLVEAPWADPEWFPNRKLEEDLPNVLKYVSQLEGQYKFLLDESKAQQERVALVGHDFGAMYGALLLHKNPEVHHAVLMAAVPDFADWFLLGRKLQPAETDTYRKKLSVIMPSRCLKCSGVSDVLFQFAENDRFVNRDQASRFIAGAPQRKQVLWYPGGHELESVSRKDRVQWLRERVGHPQQSSNSMPGSSNASEVEVIKVLRRQAEAGIRRDVALIDEVLDPQYFHTNPDGSVMTRSQVLASYKVPTTFTFIDEKMEDVKVLMDGTDHAIVNAVVILTGKRSEEPFTSRYRVTYLLRKSADAWKILNSHSSLLDITPRS